MRFGRVLLYTFCGTFYKDFKVPKLRFPEFKDEWHKCKLGDISFQYKGEKLSKQDISPSGKHYCILYGDLYTKYLNRIHKIDSRTNVENNLVLGEQGDIILPLSGETPTDISNSAVLPFNNIALGSDIIVFRPIDQNSLFLSYQISWKRKLDIAKIAQGKTIVHSSPKSLSKIFVFCPHLKEQEKISNFLSLIDEKIINMSSKIQVLKKYKEGLIDKLLISKGNDYIFLKDLIKIMPKGNLGAKMGIINGSYPFYLSGDNTSRLNSFMLNGTYIIANDGGEAGFRLTKGKFSYSDHCICFKGDNDIVTVNLFNYLNSIKRQITYKGFTGSGLKNIDRQYFFKLKIPQKIRDIQLAKVFQLVQTYIDNLDQEVKLAHLLKTNILNNMFI